MDLKPKFLPHLQRDCWLQQVIEEKLLDDSPSLAESDPLEHFPIFQITDKKAWVPALGCLIILGFFTSPVQAQQQQSVTSDDFTYTGWSTGTSPMIAHWTSNSGNAPFIMTNNSSLAPSYISLNNGVICTNLSRTLTTDFTVSIRVLQTAYSQEQWVGIFNAAGTQGYGFLWDSNAVTSFNSEGGVSIEKFSVPNATALLFNAYGQRLTIPVASGHNPGNATSAAITAPFANFQLSWSAKTYTLTLAVDGVVKATYTDAAAPYATFSRIFISGKEHGLYDSLSITTPGGASVPFLTCEAESATLSSGVTVTTLNPSVDGPQDLPQTEASGRSYASLTAPGQSITFNVPQSANSIVIRHNVPYVKPYNTNTGDGYSLHLWVNNESTPRQVMQSLNGEAPVKLGALSLSSYHNQANAAYWEESRALILGASLKSGDTLRLEVDPGDTASFYNIDCIDLEDVPAALPQPANTYSVLTYGALGNGVADDTGAIQNTIDKAQMDGKNVWIPTGTYHVSSPFALPTGVKVYGAGMWYTNLIGTINNSTPSPVTHASTPYCPGFSLAADCEVHDLFMDNNANTTRADANGYFYNEYWNHVFPSNWVIQNVWMTHTQLFCWMVGANNGLVSGCRARFTYADGIHLDAGCYNNTIKNCHVRGAGDDGIAIISNTQNSYAPTTACSNNTAVYNTVVANWCGANFDLSGGSNNVVGYNYFADSGTDGSLVINLPNGFPASPLTGASIVGNTIVRGGGDLDTQMRGAIWIFPQYAAVSGLVFDGNYIKKPIWSGIQLFFDTSTKSAALTCNNTTIDAPGTSGIDIISGVSGSGTFTTNSVLNLPPGFVQFSNNAPTTFRVTSSGNTWDGALAIINGPPPATVVASAAYNFTYLTGGYPTPTLAVNSGTLPPGLTLSPAGTISGTPTTAGIYTGSVLARNGVGTPVTQNFDITVSSPLTFWADQYFTAQQVIDPTIGGPMATPENDGVTNLLKYFFDINPTSVMSVADCAALPTGGGDHPQWNPVPHALLSSESICERRDGQHADQLRPEDVADSHTRLYANRGGGRGHRRLNHGNRR